jgi:hypothetical protein
MDCFHAAQAVTVLQENKRDNTIHKIPRGMAMLSEYAQSLVGNRVEIFNRFV